MSDIASVVASGNPAAVRPAVSYDAPHIRQAQQLSADRTVAKGGPMSRPTTCAPPPVNCNR